MTDARRAFLALSAIVLATGAVALILRGVLA